jgi:hypothetical protein
MDANGPSIGKPESTGPSNQSGRAKRARRPPKEGSMMARDRLYRRARPATLKTRAGVAAAVLAGGGAIGVGALLATSHPAAPTASPAGYANRLSNEGNMLSAAMSDWSWSRQGTYSQLAQLTSARGFSQTSQHGKMLAIQRGIVFYANHRFLILQSANGSLHLWLLSGATKFQNVSNTAAGTAALTASTSATQQAMQSGNMTPATTLLAGSPATAASMLTPTATPQTVTVQVANTDLTVTVTITRSTATVSQTATTPANAMPAWRPSTYTQNAWRATSSIARGDLAVVVGARSHGTLHAQLVLFTPLSSNPLGGTTGTTGTTGTAGSTAGGPVHW